MYTNKNACVLPPFSYKTITRINSFKVTESKILSIIKLLDSTKAHLYDNVSIRKMCSESITLPLKIISQKSLKKGEFPEIFWEKSKYSSCT